MKRLDELPKPMREYCAMFMYLRALGFESEDIYVGIYIGGIVQGLLKAQGREFRFDCGQLPQRYLTESVAFETLYGETVEAMNAATDDERRALLDTTENGKQRLELLQALARKGFKIPRSSR